MKKVIVYGVGKAFQRVRNTIENKYQILGYMDTYKKSFEDKKVFDISNLPNDFDYVFVTPYGCKAQIVSKLKSMGIDQDKIILYYGENNLIGLHTAKVNGGNVLADINGNKITLHTKSDESVFRTVFCSNEYNIMCNQKMVFIDIGMNIGLASIYAAMNDNIEKVYGFEPFPQTYNDAVNNIKNSPNVCNKIEMFNWGLYDEDKMLSVNYDKNDSQSMNIFMNKVEGLKADIQVKQAGAELTPIIEKNKDKMIVCKMDCEGAEYAIIRNLYDCGEIQKIDLYIIEWHYRDTDEITDLLIKSGFVCIKNNESDKMGMIYAWRIQ